MKKKITITAGILCKRQLRRWLEGQKYSQGEISISYIESNGFLETDFHITVTGNIVVVEAWCLATHKWCGL